MSSDLFPSSIWQLLLISFIIDLLQGLAGGLHDVSETDLLRAIGFLPRVNIDKEFGGVPILKPRRTPPGSSPKVYPYAQLPLQTSLRVLKILPEPTILRRESVLLEHEINAPIRCQMRIIDLDDPDYEALSYTWGDPLVFYRFLEDVITTRSVITCTLFYTSLSTRT